MPYNFISDPTHVRPITIFGLSMFNRALNENWEKNGAANTPKALIHDVNFCIEDSSYDLEDVILTKFNTGEIKRDELQFYVDHHNNIVKQIDIKWRVIK